MHGEYTRSRLEERSTPFPSVTGHTVMTALAGFCLLSVLAFVLVAYFFWPS